MRFARFGISMLLLAAGAACSRSKEKKIENAVLVAGIDAQPGVVSMIGKVHVLALATTGTTGTKGQRVLAETTTKPDPGKSPFPLEQRLEAPPGDEVDILVEAFGAGPNGTVADAPMLVRRARAPFTPGGTKLVRLQLESACVNGVFGFKGPACPPPQSCSRGRCIDPTLLAEDLEPYAANWATDRPDVCRPAGAGEPIVIVGTGQTDFLPLADGQTLAPEKGPQGGHHLWIAVRMKNLRQAAATIVLTAEQPGTGLKVPPTSFVFSFERDEGGYCKLHGLRFQLDNASVPVAKFLSQPLDVTVTVRDANGRSADAHKRVNVAANTIGE
jgi:hypothetical protein